MEQYIKPVIFMKDLPIYNLIRSHQTHLYETNNFELENIWKGRHSDSDN